MIKVVICDGGGTLLLPNPSLEIRNLLAELPKLGMELAVASNNSGSLIRANFSKAGLTIPRMIVTPRETSMKKPSPKFVEQIRQLAQVQPHEIVYLGDDDGTDIFCAINAKTLPFAAHYANPAMRYGLEVSSPKAFQQYLSSFGLQPSPYFGWTHSSACQETKSQIKIHVLFGEHGSLNLTDSLKSLLKDQVDILIGTNSLSLAHILFLYLLSQAYLSGITHNVDYIAVYPGHQRNSLNPLLGIYSGLLASTFKQRFIKDLLIRHTDSPQSRMQSTRRNIYDQFRTVLVNKEHAHRLKGKTVLVLDDFTTSGYSLETARRMLMQAQAKDVVGIAIAKFRFTHSVSHIAHSWDPFIPCELSAEDIWVEDRPGQFNHGADSYFQHSIWSVYAR